MAGVHEFVITSNLFINRALLECVVRMRSHGDIAPPGEGGAHLICEEGAVKVYGVAAQRKHVEVFFCSVEDCNALHVWHSYVPANHVSISCLETCSFAFSIFYTQYFSGQLIIELKFECTTIQLIRCILHV